MPVRQRTEIQNCAEGAEGAEAARFDPMKVDPALRESYLACLCRSRLYDRCVEVMELYGMTPELVEAWDNVSLRIAQARRKDLVDRLLQLRPDAPPMSIDTFNIFLDQEEPAKLVEKLTHQAMFLLADDRSSRQSKMNSRWGKRDSTYRKSEFVSSRGPLVPKVSAALWERSSRRDSVSLPRAAISTRFPLLSRPPPKLRFASHLQDILQIGTRRSVSLREATEGRAPARPTSLYNSSPCCQPASGAALAFWAGRRGFGPRPGASSAWRSVRRLMKNWAVLSR